jgi:hypothetical protein
VVAFVSFSKYAQTGVLLLQYCLGSLYFLRAVMFVIKPIRSVSLAILASTSIFLLVANCGKDNKKSVVEPVPVASPTPKIPKENGGVDLEEPKTEEPKTEVPKTEVPKTGETTTETPVVVPTVQALTFEGPVKEGFAKYCSTCHTADFYPMEKPEDFKERKNTGLQKTLAERSADRMKREIEAGGYMPQMMLAAEETQESFRTSETRKLMLEWLKNGSELK